MNPCKRIGVQPARLSEIPLCCRRPCDRIRCVQMPRNLAKLYRKPLPLFPVSQMSQMSQKKKCL